MENMKMDVNPDTQDTDQPSFVDGYLLYMMAQASHAASSAFHGQLEAIGTSVPTWRIMACLYPNRKMNVGELASKCLLKQPTLTRKLDRLCADGITERVHENRDRRGVLVSLTKKGRNQASKYVDMALRHETQILDGFSSEDIVALKRILRALCARDSTK
ncbi:MAG: MarR family transcriptional regulator [Pseudomonadota bacterium]